MKIGLNTVHCIEDHRFALDGGAMFGVVPRPLWEKKIPADKANRIAMATRCLLIEQGDKKILVDTGMGEGWSEKQRGLYGIDGAQGSMLGHLQDFGLAAQDITDVILTHLHFDHAGGVFDRDAQGQLQLRFGNATHHVQRRHLKWAEHPSEKDAGSFRPDELRALSQSGKLHLVDGDHELFPEVEVLVSEGHTVAQQLLRLRGPEHTLLYCADLIPTAAHIRLPWIMSYDLYPLISLEEKKSLLAQAIEEDWILVFEHDPKIAACRLREEKGQVVMGEVLALG